MLAKSTASDKTEKPRLHGKRSIPSLAVLKKPMQLSVTLPSKELLLYPTCDKAKETDREWDREKQKASLLVRIGLKIAAGIPEAPIIQSIRTQLTGNETIAFPQSIETNSITLACAEVQGLSSQEYLPGKTYYWDIRIEVDQNIAPYVQTLYGRLRHKIQVSLDWSTPQTWWLKSGTVQTEETVTIISVPPISNILSYSLTRQELVKHLGLIDCHLYSHHLTIGSKVFFRLALPSNASYCDIVRIEMAVLQYTTLRSRKKPGLFFYTDTPQRCSILTVDRENLKQRMQEGGFLWSARLPSCHVLGPSTLPGTKGAAIRLSHKLEMIIEYRPNDRGVIRNRSIKDTPLVHKVEWPVVLPSCACQSESLNLPAYSRDDTVQVSPINSDIRANRPQIAKCSCRSHTTRDDSDIKDLTLSLQDINLSQAMLAGAKSFDSVPKALYHSRRLAAAAVDADIVM